MSESIVMKVLMVTNIYPKPDFPGQGSFVKSQVESITREGVNVELVSIDAKKNRWNYLKAVFRIWKKIYKDRYDLIHAHYGYSGLVSRLQLRLPVLVSYCGGDILGTPDEEGKLFLWSRIDVFFARLLSLTMSAIIVKSEVMKRKLPRKKSVFVIPNGVDFQVFRPLPMREARARVKWEPEKKYILFPADPTWTRKCYPVARDAVELLRERNWDVGLMVLHSQEQKIVPWYLNACDAVVMTSYSEGSPNVIKEAMACNVPIVSTNVGDVGQIIAGCEGCFIAERNAEDVASKLERVLRLNKRTDGRERIQPLEIQSVARRIIEIYKNLAD